MTYLIELSEAIAVNQKNDKQLFTGVSILPNRVHFYLDNFFCELCTHSSVIDFFSRIYNECELLIVYFYIFQAIRERNATGKGNRGEKS